MKNNTNTNKTAAETTKTDAEMLRAEKIADIIMRVADPLERVVVTADRWETGAGWTCHEVCDYDGDPAYYDRDDLVDFVDDQLRAELDGCRGVDAIVQRLKAYADDADSDLRYTMTAYTVPVDPDDHDDHDDPVSVWHVWRSEIAKDMLANYDDHYAALKLAKTIRDNPEWDLDACAELCELADMGDEWSAAEGDAFEQVVTAAAAKLGVEIF